MAQVCKKMVSIVLEQRRELIYSKNDYFTIFEVRYREKIFICNFFNILHIKCNVFASKLALAFVPDWEYTDLALGGCITDCTCLKWLILL